MVFSYHEDGLRISTCALKAKWNGAHDDSTPFWRGFATSSAEIHRGTLPVICANYDLSSTLDLSLKRVWSTLLTPTCLSEALETMNGANGSLDVL